MSTSKGKNIGEWSEMYIFFKLINDRKVYVGDKDLNKLHNAFLNIISITFNQMFTKVTKKGVVKYEVATKERMEYLKSMGIDLKYVQTAKDVAGQNLVRCGGLEMPLIVAEMLKYFYYLCSGSTSASSLDGSANYLAENDVVGYGFDNLFDTYKVKIENLLYSMFTGLRFSKPWSGRSAVSGGYIVVKRSGEIVALHSCIADEFKDFLFDKLKFEAPSCSRHNYLKIYKKDDSKYYLKLALQFRFKLSR